MWYPYYTPFRNGLVIEIETSQSLGIRNTCCTDFSRNKYISTLNKVNFNIIKSLNSLQQLLQAEKKSLILFGSLSASLVSWKSSLLQFMP